MRAPLLQSDGPTQPRGKHSIEGVVLCKPPHATGSLELQAAGPSHVILVPHEPHEVERARGGSLVGDSVRDVHATAEAKARGRERAFFIVLYSAFFVFAHNPMLMPFLPDVITQQGYQQSTVGLVFATFPLAGFLAAPMCGRLVVRFGPESCLVWSLGLFALANGVFGVTHDVRLYFLIRILLGAMSALFQECMYVLVARIFPAEVPYRIGLCEFAIGLGATAGFLLGGCAYTWGGFPAPFFVLSAFLVSAMVLVLVQLGHAHTHTHTRDNVRPEGVDVEHGHAHGHTHTHHHRHISYLELLSRPRVLCVSVLAFTSASIYSFYDPVLEPRLQNFLGPLSNSVIGFIMSLTTMVYMLSAIVIGKLATPPPPTDNTSTDNTSTDTTTDTTLTTQQLRGRFRNMALCGLVMCACAYQMVGPSPLFLSFVLPRSALAWTLQLVGQTISATGNGLAFVPAVPWMQLEVADLGQEAKELSIALAVSAISLGEAAAPWPAGRLTDLFGYPWATTYFSFFFLLVAFILLLAFADTSDPVPPPHHHRATPPRISVLQPRSAPKSATSTSSQKSGTPKLPPPNAVVDIPAVADLTYRHPSTTAGLDAAIMELTIPEGREVNIGLDPAMESEFRHSLSPTLQPPGTSPDTPTGTRNTSWLQPQTHTPRSPRASTPVAIETPPPDLTLSVTPLSRANSTAPPAP